MDIRNIQAVAEQYQKNSKAPLGFYFKDLQTDQVISYHADEPFPTASSFKIYLLAELFRKAAAGECSLSDRIPLSAEQKAAGSGVLLHLDDGLGLTLKDYATLMMIISDNTATDVLFQYLGRDNIKKNVIDALGLTQTKCDLSCRDLIENYFQLNGKALRQLREENGGYYPSFRNSKWYCCQTEENDQTSPHDAAKMLELLYRGQWVSPEACRQMIQIMQACQTNSRLPFLLPPNTLIAHKTGTLDKLMADIGIVYTPKGDYILCMFYNGNRASEEDYRSNYLGRDGDRYMAELSGAIYSAYLDEA